MIVGMRGLLLAVALLGGCTTDMRDVEALSPLDCDYWENGRKPPPVIGQCARVTTDGHNGEVISTSESSCQAARDGHTCLVFFAGDPIVVYQPHQAPDGAVAVETAALDADGACPFVCD